MRFGDDGRLYAVNPEYGFFGVAPGTNWSTNPNAMRTIEQGHSLFTNIALTDDGDVWWEGMENTPAHATSWKKKDWTPASEVDAAHPNSRYCTPMAQCPVLAPEWDDPKGVPISAIFFGGRRKETIPLVTESRDWQHGTFLGATLSSEKTAAAAGGLGQVRRDPMAMLPFIGYNVGDYFQHWIDVGKGADAAKLPRIFYVNWFRRGDDGRFLWPGFGENSRVLKWAIERIEGKAAAQETPIGSCRPRTSSTSTGWTSTAQTSTKLSRWTPRVARRDPAHRGVVPPDRRRRCRRPCATSSTPSSTVSGCSARLRRRPRRHLGNGVSVSPFGLESRKLSVSGPTIPRDEVVEPGEGPVSEPMNGAGRGGGLRVSPWNLLLLVPFLMLITPWFNSIEPRLFGMPFFYWIQFAFVPVGVVVRGGGVRAHPRRGGPGGRRCPPDVDELDEGTAGGRAAR